VGETEGEKNKMRGGNKMESEIDFGCDTFEILSTRQIYYTLPFYPHLLYKLWIALVP
jgi:hypothetical protein